MTFLILIIIFSKSLIKLNLFNLMKFIQYWKTIGEFGLFVTLKTYEFSKLYASILKEVNKRLKVSILYRVQIIWVPTQSYQMMIIKFSEPLNQKIFFFFNLFETGNLSTSKVQYAWTNHTLNKINI